MKPHQRHVLLRKRAASVVGTGALLACAGTVVIASGATSLPFSGDRTSGSVHTSSELSLELGLSAGANQAPTEESEVHGEREDPPVAPDLSEPWDRPQLKEPSVPVEDETIGEVDTAVSDALGATSDVATDSVPEVIQDELPDVADGALLAELQAQLAEYDSRGWKQDGSPVLEDIQVLKVDRQDNPSVLVVQACVDWSEVRYLDSEGNALPSGATPRALNVFTLERVDENGTMLWIPVSRDFPADPAC